MKMRTLKRKLLGLVAPVLLLAAWDYVTRRELFSPQLLPPSEMLLETWWDMQTSGELALNMRVSLCRVAGGFALGAALGFALGTAMATCKAVDDYLGPLFNTVRQVPIVGWLPFLIVWLGIGELFKVAFISLGALIPMALKTDEGIKAVSPGFLELARVFEFGRFRQLTKIMLPSALPSLLIGLRLSLSEAWMLVVAAELVAASVGIGNTMTVARRLFQTDVVLVSVIAIAITGYLGNALLALLEARLLASRRPTCAQ